MLLPPECKYSNCEKALLCTVWAIQRFSNYAAQKVHRKSLSRLVTSQSPKEPAQPQMINHRYFEENVCEGMPTAYVDGCSYNHKGNLQAGVGVVWLNNDPCPPQQLKLGPQSSQYAEIAAILITLQLAASHNIK